MRFSQFVDVFVAALYNETELTGRSEFLISDMLEKYGLSLSPIWGERLFDDYTFSSRVDARRHLGPLYQQRVRLSAEGLRWVEDELGENVSQFLEQNGAHYAEPAPPNAITTEDGEPILTEGGDYILVEDADVARPNASSVPISSQNWTGLPREGVLTAEASDRLKIALKVVDDAVERSSVSNEERAQARAYVLAIHALADAPEPPADLIWNLIERANSVAGMAAFFVSLIALFAHA